MVYFRKVWRTPKSLKFRRRRVYLWRVIFSFENEMFLRYWLNYVVYRGTVAVFATRRLFLFMLDQTVTLRVVSFFDYIRFRLGTALLLTMIIVLCRKKTRFELVFSLTVWRFLFPLMGTWLTVFVFERLGMIQLMLKYTLIRWLFWLLVGFLRRLPRLLSVVVFKRSLVKKEPLTVIVSYGTGKSWQ